MKSKPNFFARVSPALAVITLAAMTQAAHAAALTWDGSDTLTAGAQGGAGTWDSNTTLNWWDGVANVVWPNTGTDNEAVFGGTAGTVTIAGGGVTANDLLFNTTGYVLSGAGTITLNGTTPTITTGTGASATIGNNTATVLAGSAGMTKAGAGTLTLSGSTVNTFTGGLSVKGGTLALSLANLVTPTNLTDSGNALSMYNGGTLSVTGKNGSFNSAQSVNGTAVYTGNSAITVNNASGTSTTLTLGTVTQAEIGGVLSMASTNGGIAPPNTTTQVIKASNTINSYIGSWAVVGDSKGGTGRWAYVNASGQVTALAGTAAGTNMASVTNSTTVYTITGTNTLAADKTAFALQDNDTGSSSVTLGNFNITTNGLSQIRTGGSYTRSYLQGTGSGKIIVGASNELVAMGLNNLTIAAPIANGAGGNSNVTYAGGGTLLLSAANTYSGQTTVNSGIVQVGTGGTINLSNGIKINGGKFLQTNTATAITPAVTLQGGSIDGTGTITTVNVSDLAANKITNGNGTSSALTIGSLTLGGDATIDIRTAGSAGLIVSGTLTTTPANGTVVVNVTSAPTWVTGNTYNLISYGTLSGSLGDFTKGTIPGLGARQSSSLVTSGSNIALSITGDSARWTGVASGAWTTNTVGTPFNWKTLTGGADTEFLASDDVVFDDTGVNTTNVDISTANVSPNSIIFNNSTKNYVISSTGGFGISAGTLTKSGTGTVTLSTANTYSGTTTINGGTLLASGGSAISNTGLVTLANASGVTFQITGSETIGALSGGGATGGSVSIDAGQTLTTSSGSQTYAGSVSGSGAYTNAGATQTISGVISNSGGINASSGILTLSSSANSYTGAVAVSVGGGLVVAANNALGGTTDGTTVTGGGIGNGGVLGFTGGINYSATEKITGSGLGNTSAFGVFASVQRGFIQSVSGNNTFAGNIEINATGLSRIGTQDGAQLTLTGSITRATGVTGVQVLFRVGNTSGDFITLSNSGNSWDTDASIFTGAASGSAGVRLGVDNALPVTQTITGASSNTAATTLDLNGYNQTLNGLINSFAGNASTLSISNSNTGQTSTLTLNPSADKTAGAGVNATTIANGAGIVAVVKSGLFNQTFNSTHTYTGGTRIDAGTLTLGHATNTLADAGAVNVNGGTLAITTSNDTVGAVTLTSGSITGTTGVLTGSSYTVKSGTISAILGGSDIALTKDTAGTVTLSGSNTYTGTTTISEGKLVMGDAASDNFDTSGVTVASGATLGGSGTIAGTLGLTGVLAPGDDGIGTLAAATTTWNGGGNTAETIWQFDLSATNGISDKLEVNGDFTKGTPGTYKFDFMNSAPNALGNIYTLVTWTGTTNFSVSDFSWTNLGGSFNGLDSQFTLNANSLTFTAVPEPTSALAGLLISAGLLRRRRK